MHTCDISRETMDFQRYQPVIAKQKWTLSVVVLLSFVICADFALAGELAENSGDNIRQFFVGYGVTHPGLGKTKTHVETVDFIGRYEHVFPGRIGPRWLPARHSIFVELPVHLVVAPDVSPIVGINFLGAFTFETKGNYKPYWFFGGGPLYTDAEIAGLGAKVNGNYQFGIGLIWKRDNWQDIRLEYRFHHISNAGAKDPNDPLNSSKLLVGFEF